MDIESDDKRVPESLIIIAGKGAYPLELAQSARDQGVRRICAVAFKGETSRRLQGLVDEICWVNIGSLAKFLKCVGQYGIEKAVMAGQITPTALFRLRPDKKMLNILSGLKLRNAETLFGAVASELSAAGVQLQPAYLFMKGSMPAEGLLSSRAPNEREDYDIKLGIKVAKTTSGLEIGQTVVVKEGTIVAVEAFEGTDQTILRAGRLCRKGAVVVKLAKHGHDMRFDIPVVGMRTMRVLKRSGATALALEAERTILLERERVIKRAEELGVAIVAFKA